MASSALVTLTCLAHQIVGYSQLWNEGCHIYIQPSLNRIFAQESRSLKRLPCEGWESSPIPEPFSWLHIAILWSMSAGESLEISPRKDERGFQNYQWKEKKEHLIGSFIKNLTSSRKGHLWYIDFLPSAQTSVEALMKLRELKKRELE